MKETTPTARAGRDRTPIEHHYERGWRRYGFDNLPFSEASIHGSDVPIGVRNIFNRGQGRAHISFGVIPPSGEVEAIGMHIHRDVPSGTDVEEWYIIIDGEGQMTFSSGDTVEVTGGDLVAIYPGTGHSFRATGSSPLRLISITPEMYTSDAPVTDVPTDFGPRIEVGEVDGSMNPLGARCRDCGASWSRPDHDRAAATLAVWARTHPCRDAAEPAR